MAIGLTPTEQLIKSFEDSLLGGPVNRPNPFGEEATAAGQAVAGRIRDERANAQSQNTNSAILGQGVSVIQAQPLTPEESLDLAIASGNIVESDVVPIGQTTPQNQIGQGTVLQEPDNRATINQTTSQAGSPQAGSPQANFLAEKAKGPLSPEQIAQAEEFASSMGTTFDPNTGYSRDAFVQSQEQISQDEASRQASLTGTPMPGQTLSQFMRYEDQPEQRTEQFVDPQGRLRSRMTPEASALAGLPEGQQPLAPEYSPFEMQSMVREAKLGMKPDFMLAQPVESRRIAGKMGVPTQSEMRRIEEGNLPGATANEVAEAKRIQARYKIDPLTGKASTPSFEPGVVELGGRQFLQQRDGELEELDTPEAGLPLGEILNVGGVEYVRTGPKTISPLKRDATGNILEGPAIEEIEKVFGKEIGEWLAGGKERAESNIKIYEDLMRGLESGAITTGTLREQLTPTVAGLDDKMRAIFNPVGQDAVDRIRLVVFQSLRDTLGAQFTQREAERLTAATFNTDLSPEQNLERLRDVSMVLERTSAAKNALAEHYQAGGNFFNYKGPKPLESFNAAVDELGATLGQQPTQPSETPGATQPKQPRYKFTRRN